MGIGGTVWQTDIKVPKELWHPIQKTWSCGVGTGGSWMAVWKPGASVWAVSRGWEDAEEDDIRLTGIDASSRKRELRWHRGEGIHFHRKTLLVLYRREWRFWELGPAFEDWVGELVHGSDCGKPGTHPRYRGMKECSNWIHQAKNNKIQNGGSDKTRSDGLGDLNQKRSLIQLCTREKELLVLLPHCDTVINSLSFCVCNFWFL